MGACFEVYKHMGPGFVESVYHECLTHEFHDQALPFSSRSSIDLMYKHHQLEKKSEPDFVCFGKIIVEIKALSAITNDHRAQVHNYLKATRFKLGLLVNFGHYPKLEWERIVR